MRHDVEFESQGTTLRGWYYPAQDVDGPSAAVVLTHGFASVKEMFDQHDYAAVFARAGIASVVYDHINCGDSGGDPRFELDPVKQQRTYQDAVTWLCARDDVDEDRIGIWGTSYSGGHVLVVGAYDPRVRAVVSQVPTITGFNNYQKRLTVKEYAEAKEAWKADRLARARGDAPGMSPVYSEPSFPEFMKQMGPDVMRNFSLDITTRSWEMYHEYEPGASIHRISPKPLLMIVALDDTMVPSVEALDAFERAREPKRLLALPGWHYSVYNEHFDTTSSAARDWFLQHLEPVAT